MKKQYVAMLIDACCEYYGITRELLFGSSNVIAKFKNAKKVAYYLMREHFDEAKSASEKKSYYSRMCEECNVPYAWFRNQYNLMNYNKGIERTSAFSEDVDAIRDTIEEYEARRIRKEQGVLQG